MADGVTDNLELVLPEVGASTDTWGTKLNSNFVNLDALFNEDATVKTTAGGTGLATYTAAGRVLRSTAATTLAALALGTARQLLQVNAGATDLEWASNIDIPGTLDVTGAVTLDSTLDVVGVASFDEHVDIAATKRLRLDGGGDTYINESSANAISLVAGGVQSVVVTATGATVNGNQAVGGTLDVTGAATCDSTLDVGDDVTVTGNVTADEFLGTIKPITGIDLLGNVLTLTSPSTRTTIGANGAASALTALPLGYLDVDVDGVSAQVPYYTRGA